MSFRIKIKKDLYPVKLMKPNCYLTSAALLLLMPLSVLAASPAADVIAETAKAIKAESAAQADYSRWADQKEALGAEIRDLKATDTWLDFQNEKYAAYINKQHEVIAELQRRKQEARRIQMELEPFLETIVDDLALFIQSDLPFLAEERAARVAFLRDSLGDYRLELSEKLRRVFEALHVEAEYGRTIEVSAQELTIEGEPRQVSLFRLGRTALYYTTGDGARAGMWNAATQTWQSLDQDTARTLHKAEEMAARKRAVELLQLPIGKVQ
jgi:hypothetical protein